MPRRPSTPPDPSDAPGPHLNAAEAILARLVAEGYPPTEFHTQLLLGLARSLDRATAPAAPIGIVRTHPLLAREARELLDALLPPVDTDDDDPFERLARDLADS